MTIFLTTHYLDEADSMAERVMIMDNGMMIANDTPERLKADLAGDRITVDTDQRDEPPCRRNRRQPARAREVARDGRRAERDRRDGEALLPEFIRRLHESGIDRGHRVGAPPDPRRCVPRPHRPLAARTAAAA